MDNDLIEEYGYPVQIERTTPGEFNQNTGKWTGGMTTMIDTIAAILPMDKSETENKLSTIGIEDRDAVAIYSTIELLESSEKTKQDRDTLIWDTRRYVIVSCVPRMQIEGLEHFKSIGVLEGS